MNQLILLSYFGGLLSGLFLMAILIRIALKGANKKSMNMKRTYHSTKITKSAINAKLQNNAKRTSNIYYFPKQERAQTRN